ncbi:hypothetical protein I546_5353 [Mycobacterium kansasii 732]|nr:hypothetical protein I546_5353 [Mycobacterium kansasii 732]
MVKPAQRRWRLVNAPHPAALVRAGAEFKTASSSNDPRNQEVKLGPHNTRFTGIDYCSVKRSLRDYSDAVMHYEG